MHGVALLGNIRNRDQYSLRNVFRFMGHEITSLPDFLFWAFAHDDVSVDISRWAKRYREIERALFFGFLDPSAPLSFSASFILSLVTIVCPSVINRCCFAILLEQWKSDSVDIYSMGHGVRNGKTRLVFVQLVKLDKWGDIYWTGPPKHHTNRREDWTGCSNQ